ncbi:Hypothetical protein EUBELI_20599 (plasmid) [Lachnospira eligens ATCC 27750]|uniref:Uncharacterized protein n=1 Tax=Lachnospira eligens (strain ATCC 27750 / DSM 3376 / VPI C15-48 / C15-B4) TaxID=515620 RepID=C4Z701_LACE2|nr:Hypothetical protein EUBELI_20599 [[Eubacterium] eligens ATCC 27750]
MRGKNVFQTSDGCCIGRLDSHLFYEKVCLLSFDIVYIKWEM